MAEYSVPGSIAEQFAPQLMPQFTPMGTAYGWSSALVWINAGNLNNAVGKLLDIVGRRLVPRPLNGAVLHRTPDLAQERTEAARET